MAKLGLHPGHERSYTVPADFFNEKTKSRGSIQVTFNCNWHSGEGPYLEFGEEFRSFGIRYTQFKPLWQEMRWDEPERTLTVRGDGYQFSLTFS